MQKFLSGSVGKETGRKTTPPLAGFLLLTTVSLVPHSHAGGTEA
jgi:hypothetical protein